MSNKSQLCIVNNEVCIIIRKYLKKAIKIYHCCYSNSTKQSTEYIPMCIVYMPGSNKIYDVKSYCVEYI
jgi:hypothetical protein